MNTVEAGATVQTDAWTGYPRLGQLGFGSSGD
jgi:hypothetical protein